MNRDSPLGRPWSPIALIIIGAMSVWLISAAWPLALRAAEQNADILPADQKGLEVGADRNDYTLTFSIESIPSDPKLQLDFKVVRKGWCPRTYRATKIWLNKRLLAQIDFRKFAKNDDIYLSRCLPMNPTRARVGSAGMLCSSAHSGGLPIMATNDPLPLEQIIAPVFGALYWLLYYQIGRDLFPETAVHSLNQYQDRVVRERTTQLIEEQRRSFLDRASRPPDSQPG